MQIGRVVFRRAPHIHSDTKPIHAVVQAQTMESYIDAVYIGLHAQTHRSAANAEREICMHRADTN